MAAFERAARAARTVGWLTFMDFSQPGWATNRQRPSLKALADGGAQPEVRTRWRAWETSGHSSQKIALRISKTMSLLSSDKVLDVLGMIVRTKGPETRRFLPLFVSVLRRRDGNRRQPVWRQDTGGGAGESPGGTRGCGPGPGVLGSSRNIALLISKIIVQ
jgi:hypothetical protein